MNKEYTWTYGENDCQNYYEVNNGKGKDYLCVFANKKYPDIWMGMYIKGKIDITVMDKTFNDKERKKDEKNGIMQTTTPRTIRILAYKDHKKMQKKLIYAYEHDLEEVSK